MFKRICSLILCGALVVGMTGCGPSDSKGDASASSGKNSNSDYDLLVWEDQSKSGGIGEAIKKFEEEKDVNKSC